VTGFLVRAVIQFAAKTDNDLRPVQKVEHGPIQWPNISGRVCHHIDPGAGGHHPGEGQQQVREPLLTTEKPYAANR
jgi:hypothetical protein